MATSPPTPPTPPTPPAPAPTPAPAPAVSPPVYGFTKADLLAGNNPAFEADSDDEPLFVLRSTDPDAEHLVRDWARLYHATKLADRAPPRNGSEAEVDAFNVEQLRRRTKYEHGLFIAERMGAFRRVYEGSVGTPAERLAAANAYIRKLPRP